MITLFLHELDEKLKSLPQSRALRARRGQGRRPLTLYGPKGGFLAFVVSRFLETNRASSLIVVPTEQEANNLAQDLALFGVQAHTFPWWGNAAYKEAAAKSSVHGRRLEVLSRLAAGRSTVVIAPLRSLLTPVPPPAFLSTLVVRLEAGGAIEPQALAERLTALGYLRVPRVSLGGEFALRGEVVDVRMAGAENAIRVVFDEERVQEIRLFGPESQTSRGSIPAVDIYPVREWVWTEERRNALAERMRQIPELHGAADAINASIETRGSCPHEDLLFYCSFDAPASLADYFTPVDEAVLLALERMDGAYESMRKEYDGLYRRARLEHAVPAPERVLLDWPALRSRVDWGLVVPVLRPEDGGAIELPTDPPRSFFGNLTFLKEELSALTLAGHRIFVFADSAAQAGRISTLLAEQKVTVVDRSISSGFSVPDLKFTVIHEHEIFGRRRRVNASVHSAPSRVLDTFVELNPGDHVVHVNYGIGRFVGIKRLTALGNERDYIQLEYSGEETVFLPIEQVNLIQRFIGNEGASPRLDTIGGKSWENRKNRVRASVEDLARRLVDLYSRRTKARGHAFSRDTEWQIEFEASFPYEETEDQARCIEEVKADMERPQPMDRLICGDVGYGKTEIAMRAAFKAAADGKQVAVLAPTTILAEQHYENISERMARFPVRVGMLSRFVPRKDQKAVIEGLRTGRIDVVVGTHRVIQKDVQFKDLGLIIIDEEQRFGVKDKERLKELKTSVDCLALTATPIPRTLHMSLLKIRDMSILNTPPANRLPIETTIGDFSEDVVASAVRAEVSRGGQVYYLHNRIESLEEVERFLRRVVPEVLVESAHGQMHPGDLEDIMHRFVHGGFHVLVSTTIIENGIDIPNVNTIIIDRADMYGISQLYQLRGRVGRSGKKAYAYLFYPGERAMSEIAMKRLQIVSDHTELGSGFKIALKDLEVRGAGNLLGREQSGDILSVGFDMYLRLLDEAIRALSDAQEEQPCEPYLDLEYSGYIPDSYIGESTEKMEVYKKIASVTRDEELLAVHAELLDRFGPLPEEVESLFALAELRILCARLSIASLKERAGVAEVEFARVADISVNRVLSLIQESMGRVRLDPRRPNVLLLSTGSIGLKEKSEFIRDRLTKLG